MQSRLARVISRISQLGLPGVTADGAASFAANLGAGMASVPDRVEPAYRAALKELTKPAKNDGVDNLLAAISAANEILELQGKVMRIGTNAFLASWFQLPQFHREGPKLLKEIVDILEKG